MAIAVHGWPLVGKAFHPRFLGCLIIPLKLPYQKIMRLVGREEALTKKRYDFRQPKMPLALLLLWGRELNHVIDA